MPYVMVPVPEEQVENVMRLILRASERASLVDWDAETLAAFYAEVDEESRHLLGSISRAVLDGKDVTERDAAAMIELSARETMGIIREINERSREKEHPPLVQPRVVTDILPTGRTQDSRVFDIEPELAAVIRDVEREDLLSRPSPLAERERE